MFKNGINCIPIDFYEQSKHFRGPRTNFTFSPQPSNNLLAILKNLSELEEKESRV
jgi:hypothetical protein